MSTSKYDTYKPQFGVHQYVQELQRELRLWKEIASDHASRIRELEAELRKLKELIEQMPDPCDSHGVPKSNLPELILELKEALK